MADRQKSERLAFTCSEVAAAAGISVPMTRKLIRDKKLIAIRIGRCVQRLGQEEDLPSGASEHRPANPRTAIGAPGLW